MQDITLNSINVTLLPVLVLSLALLAIGFIKKKYKVHVYRLIIAFLSFWIFYYILPAIILQNQGLTPQISMFAGSDFTAWMKLYLLSFSNLFYGFTLFLAFPLTMYPFIFLLSPFFSIIILAIYVDWKNLREVSIWADFKRPPPRLITREEKDMFKLLLALLPFSIYFLTTILQALNIPENPLIYEETTLGWILEMYVMYLFAFVICFHLLASVRVYYKNKFIGEKIRNTAFRTILLVGMILSIMSLYSYIVQNPELIYVFIFFSAYYIMTSIIFIMLFRFFEPVSVYVFAKIISLIKTRKVSSFFKDLGTTLGFSIGVGFVILGYYHYVVQPVTDLLLVNFSLSLIRLGIAAQPTADELLSANIILGLSNFWLYFDYIIISLLSIFLIRRYNYKPLHVVIPAATIRVIVSFFFPHGVHYWITSVTTLAWLGDEIISFPRYALLEISFSEVELLRITLETFSLVFSCIGTFGSILAITVWIYLHLGNVIQVTAKGEEQITRVLGLLIKPGKTPKVLKPAVYVVPRQEKFEGEDLNENEQTVFSFIKSNIPTLAQLRKSNLVDSDILPSILLSLWSKRRIHFLEADVLLAIPLTKLVGLYVVMKDGRGVYSKSFAKVEVGSELVSGMLSAITSFVKETTKSEDYLRLIDHGDIVLLIEYGTNVFATLLAERETPEIRMRLKRFLKEFEENYSDKLTDWTGDLRIFAGAEELTKRIFERGVF